MCKMFKAGKSGYHDWLSGKPSKGWSYNEILAVEIRNIFKESFGSYVAPRIRAELLKRGYSVPRP